MGAPIKGLTRLSAIEYPGKTCAVAFLGGCNFRCPFCHNRDLVERPGSLPDIKESEVLGLLESRRTWLDGLTITGGEPCMHRELPGFMKSVKDAGFLVKLDTNGSFPEVLEDVLGKGLADYVAMDIKAPSGKYARASGVRVDTRKIERSVDIIMKSGIEYEFRTTAVPGLFTEADARAIAKWLSGAERYFLQRFLPRNTLDRTFESRASFSEEELRAFADIMKGGIGEVGVRM